MAKHFASLLSRSEGTAAAANSGISIAGVSVYLRGKKVLDDVGFSARPGDVVGLMGPNGSGKSTFLKLLAGLVAPSSGSGWVCGARLGGEAVPSCGIMFETPPFIDELTGAKNLELLAAYGCSAAEGPEALMRSVGLDPGLRTPVRAYSQGMRKRLGLAQAIMDEPALLLLDEPMNGLDPEGVAMLRGVVRERAARGCIVAVSSHLLHELEAMCGAVYMVLDGRFAPVGDEVLARRSLEEDYLSRLGSGS